MSERPPHPDHEVEPADFDPDESVGGEGRAPLSRWRMLARWCFALLLMVGAVILPILLLGIRLHGHPWTSWRGTRAPDVAGLEVRVSPSLAFAPTTVLEVAGARLLHIPLAQTVEPRWGEEEPDTVRVTLANPRNPTRGWHLAFAFTRGGEGLARVSATADDEAGSPRALTGTLLVNTLEWQGPGPRFCLFALHSEGDDPLCFSGSFAIER